MKQQTDALVASDDKLQQFLTWVSQKSLSVKVPYKPAAVRAFYFALARVDLALVPVLNRAIARALDLALITAPDPKRDSILFRALDQALERGMARGINFAIVPALILVLDLALDPALESALERERRQVLQEIKEQLPDPDGGEEIFRQWWEAKSQAWNEQLRSVMIKHRNIGHNWQFSDQQKEVLRQYYDANKLLVDCLNNSCNVTPAVRSQIEETLLLPIAEIEKYR
jgi:predicted NACHT family NTPase